MICVLVGFFCFCSCQDNKRLDAMEEKLVSLEKQKEEIENERQTLERERDSIKRINELLEQLSDEESQGQQKKKNVQSNQPTRTSSISPDIDAELQRLARSQSQANLRRLGSVDLYTFDENNNIEKVEWWWVVPYGEDYGLYLNRTGGVDAYELHVGSAKYHVSVGKFRLTANNGYFEFSAHAGKYYFDI